MSSALGTHTNTHTLTAYRQHTPYHAHVCTLTHSRMHGHTCTRRRYHPSACSLPDEHLHPPGGAAPLSPGSRDLASGPLPAPFMWARGIISLYVCVCVRVTHSEVASISVLWKRASHLCALCACVSGSSAPEASETAEQSEARSLQGTED